MARPKTSDLPYAVKLKSTHQQFGRVSLIVSNEHKDRLGRFPADKAFGFVKQEMVTSTSEKSNGWSAHLFTTKSRRGDTAVRVGGLIYDSSGEAAAAAWLKHQCGKPGSE